MDAIQLLVRQHRAMEELLDKALEAKGQDRTAAFALAADQLSVHIAAEEQIFYPAVRAARTEGILLESLEEHLSLKRLLADLLNLEPDDETFEPKLKVLQEQAEHHHEEEEENLFPKVEQLLDAERRGAVGQEMLNLEARLQNEGEPRDAVLRQTDAAPSLSGEPR